MKACLSPEVVWAMGSMDNPRVREIAKELAEHGLAVAVPHIHEEGCSVRSLPDDQIQLETDLHVSFHDKEQFEQDRRNAFPVMWRFNPHTGTVEACAYCCD